MTNIKNLPAAIVAAKQNNLTALEELNDDELKKKD